MPLKQNASCIIALAIAVVVSFETASAAKILYEEDDALSPDNNNDTVFTLQEGDNKAFGSERSELPGDSFNPESTLDRFTFKIPEGLFLTEFIFGVKADWRRNTDSFRFDMQLPFADFQSNATIVTTDGEFTEKSINAPTLPLGTGEYDYIAPRRNSSNSTNDVVNFPLTDEFTGADWEYELTFVVEDEASLQAVPVPASIWLLGASLFGLCVIARQRRE
jgi:hypothetical protein